MTLRALAKQAIGHWGVPDSEPRLISHRENAVFAVTMADGQKAALRLHRPGYNSIEEIEWELWWTDTLANSGFPAPKPVATPKGALLVSLSDGRVATVISWVEGRPIGLSEQLLAGSTTDQISLYRNVGALLARLHNATDNIDFPQDFARRHWDIAGLLGDRPLWGRFWEHPALTPEAVRLIQAARAKAIADLAEYSRDDRTFGLIHADALRENVFIGPDGLTLIDFDDSGFGYRMFDLAVAVSQSIEDEIYPKICTAVLDGYDTVRPLRSDDRTRLPLFALLRTFASLGWIVPRVPADDPAHDKFIHRAVLQCNRYLDAR